MKTKNEAYAQRMEAERHHARLESHGLRPITVFVLPDDQPAIEAAADQINRRRGYINSVFSGTGAAPLVRSTPEADADDSPAAARTTALTAKFLVALPDLADGEQYAGIVLDDAGHPTHHLILLPQRPAHQLDWLSAIVWAESIGGELPTRQEQALLYANAPQDFTASYYWSSEQTEPLSSHAWGQNFTHGGQAHLDKAAYEVRTRAVRRQLID